MTRQLTGRHVLLALLGFFAVVFAVNGTFIWMAVKSFSGVTAERAYDKGLHYNEALADARRQAGLGWRSAAGMEDGRVVATFADAAGRPLDGLSVAARLARPATAAADRLAVLEGLGAGRYRMAEPLPAAGAWLLVLSAEDGVGHRHDATHRFWVKP